MSAPKQNVIVRSFYDAWEEAKIKSGETVYPTYLVTLDSNGQFVANTVQGQPALVVMEDDLRGKTIDDQITATYRARAKYLAPGEQVIVTVVDSLAVAVADLLTSSATAGKVGALLGAGTTLAALNLASQPSEASAIPVVPAQLVLRAEAALTAEATERRIVCTVLRT